MKKILQYSCLTAFLMISPFISLRAQPHAGITSEGGNVGGGRIGAAGGAPIGSGTYILLTLAAVYTGRKVYVLPSDPADE